MNVRKGHFLKSENKKAIISIVNNSRESEDVHNLSGITTDSKRRFQNKIN